MCMEHKSTVFTNQDERKEEEGGRGGRKERREEEEGGRGGRKRREEEEGGRGGRERREEEEGGRERREEDLLVKKKGRGQVQPLRTGRCSYFVVTVTS